jgi:hypothetical protein
MFQYPPTAVSKITSMPESLATFGESRRDSDFIPFAQLCERVGKEGLKLVEKRGPLWEYTARFRMAFLDERLERP